MNREDLKVWLQEAEQAEQILMTCQMHELVKIFLTWAQRIKLLIQLVEKIEE